MIKCVAIDDEPIALTILQEYCRRLPDIDLTCFTSPAEGMDFIAKNRPQLVLLDIELNSHNGIELARTLPPDTCIVFTTAYSQYALDGFNADAIDFLHKPIFFSRFERAIDKARKYIGIPAPETDATAIALRMEHKNVIINSKDIILIEAMDNYVKVHRRDLPKVMSQITMKEMESLLPPAKFMRIHRSYIVNLDAVDKFSNRRITLRDFEFEVPVGRKYLQTFCNLYHNSQSNK